MVAVAEGVVDQGGEPAGAGLDEDAVPGGVQGLGQFAEADRFQQVPYEQLAYRLLGLWEGRGGRPGPDRHGRRVEPEAVGGLPDGREVRFQHRRVEAGAERQYLADHPLRAQGPYELLDRRAGPADHGLAGRVVVGEHDPGVRPGLGERGPDSRGGGAERGEGEAGDGHRVRVEPGHERVHLVRRVQSGRRHGRPLADAVPGDRVRYDTHAAQRLVQQAAHPDDPVAVPSDVTDPDVRAGQRREAEVGGDVVGAGREVGLQAREDERQPPAGAAEQRARPEPHVAAALPGPALGNGTAGQGEPLGGRCHDPEPDRAGVRVRPGRVETGGENGRVVGAEEGREVRHTVGGEQQDPLGLVDLHGSGRGHGRHTGRLFRHRTGGGPRGHSRGARILGRSLRPVDRRTRRLPRPGRLLQHHMGVDPAESEGVHRGSAEGLPGGGLPGAGLVHRVEAGGGECGVWGVAVEGGQEGAVVEGEDGFDQAGDPGGRHGVADHRLHRAEDRTEGIAGWRAEHLGQRGEFGRVSGGGRGAVGLQQADGVRCGGVEPGGPPGLPYGSGLPGRVGGGECRRTAVAGHAGAPDHRVHAVAGAFGVREPLQYDDARALADEDAVGVAVEGADALGRGQGAQLGEDAPEGDVVAVVHSPGEHQIAAAGGEFGDRLVHGDQ
ncbi:hypothetical protein BFF78_35130 [Streptomyces fodineus]|uniref:Uncharacterized protein n=1 Tax=Streptomyces fodineus TaxID=1904616 RepID=A0A1D7YJ37_9ACTN|nr:hypothetical protein BFF78_35130 [Streptomyces fodineus]